jgi:hypothetical protein
MNRAGRMVAGCFLLLGLGGCTPLGTYWRSRGADFLDTVPVSGCIGWGIGISAQATPLFGFGLGLSPLVSQRFGYADRTFHGVWSEYNLLFPWTFWLEDLTQIPGLPWSDDSFWDEGVPLMFRWQVMRDAPNGEGWRDHLWEPNPRSWGRHPPVVREWQGAFLWPMQGGFLEFSDLRYEQGDDELGSLWSPDRASFWETRRVRRSTVRQWDLFEIDAMILCFGLRVGFRPAEAADFLVGWVGLDPLGDDLPEPLVWEPEVMSSVTAMEQLGS